MYQLYNPYYLYLLLTIPVLLLVYLMFLLWKNRVRKKYGDPNLLKIMAPEKSVAKPTLKFILSLLIIGLLSLALVNPKIGTRIEKVKRRGIDIVFALDISKSMLAEDIPPSRLAKAKQIISRILDELISDRVGIIIYAGRAYPQLPITTDYGAARLFLKSVGTEIIPSQGTAIAEAVELSLNYFDDESQKNRVLVILSDGEDHEKGFQKAAKKAGEYGIIIHTVGIGTIQGGPIPDYHKGIQIGYKKDREGNAIVTKLQAKTLRDIAITTKGSYINGNSTRQVVEALIEYVEGMEKKEFETHMFADYEDQFQWFLGLAIMLMMLDVFVLERKTQWFKRLRLFENEKTRN